MKQYLLLMVLAFNCLFVNAKDIDFPTIKNKQGITVVVEKGHWTEYVNQYLAPEFTRLTQVPVKIIELELAHMQDVQTQSMVNAKSQYDVVTLEAGWAKEWASKGYTIPLNSLAKKYDKKKQRWKNFLKYFFPSLIEILSYKGLLYSVPYNTYVMGNHYRYDLFNDVNEQANFQAQYHYKLAPPKTLDQLTDVAKFFTRKKGQLLKGQVLNKNFYGVALMSGNKPHINDEWSAILWAKGGYWFKPNYVNKHLLNFSIPNNDEFLKQTALYYLNLKQYAFPANESFAYIESAEALSNGDVAMWPFAYNNLWVKSSLLKSNDPKQRFAISATPGGKPYHGAYAFSVAYDSKNPEAAFWFLRFMTSKQGQFKYANGGGNPTRKDVSLELTQKIKLFSPQHYALKASFKANMAWSGDIKNHGHYMSTAMGTIYPLLSQYAYLIASKELKYDVGINKLMFEMMKAQNENGEKAMVMH
ncbi:ABC transporter substrate-binding protein [Pseudoalteromonas denitrificans]|uniref:Carbohydrate ABC transporter substrate-binding protein, CUT1 family n=1 Tax=Pseudoalteromonas denitrificans DSM 6059 TaxID=1123010 RepID=A0A1I1GQN1_9GAMM|nr:extracellular solute-binding protein [Pseudoalteromonas denitrificans]SFC13811.1 carbohydrate ABC transporter substrate-binding protein, CUT1 family [Pseudoalteromonas denitrificans DSM 6059]